MWYAVLYFCFSVSGDPNADMGCTAHAMPQIVFKTESACMSLSRPVRKLTADRVREQVDGALIDFSYRCLMIPERV